jgi:hypothetical protein
MLNLIFGAPNRMLHKLWLLGAVTGVAGADPALFQALQHKFALSGQTGGQKVASGEWRGSSFVLNFGPTPAHIEFARSGGAATLTETSGLTYAGSGGKAEPYWEYVFQRPGTSDVMYTFIQRQHDLALQVDTRAPGGTWMPEATWFLHPIDP